MDGEGIEAPDVRAHLSTCARCAAFADGARRAREAVRASGPEPAPDLGGAIMTRVRAEAAAVRPRAILPRPAARVSGGIGARPRWRTLVAAALVGAVLGVTLVTQGLLPRKARPAFAGNIPREIAAAARGVDGYSAAYRVIERGWRASVPVRTFDVNVAFASPERFAVTVRDTTGYPPGGWIPNDSRLVVDGARWWLRGPEPCVAGIAGACSTSVTTRTVTGRPPFDGDAPMPTDVILPMTTLAGSGSAQVLGESTVAGRPAVEVGLSAQDAAPLFAFFQQAGSWRPFYPTDRVSLWLDPRTWFPLAYTVTASAGQDRAAWAATNGLPHEAAGAQLLSVRLTTFSTATPPASDFGIPPASGSAVVDEGFVPASPGALSRSVGFAPVEPSCLAGLSPYRSGSLASAPGTALLSYSNGLAWLKIDESRTYRGPGLFGNMDAFAQRVVLPGGGTGYYEPATAQVGRRVSIHSNGLDIYLESNLPPSTLLRIAGSLPVKGVDLPSSWAVQRAGGGLIIARVPFGEALRRAGFPVLVPRALPAGYGMVASQLIRFPGGSAVALYYGRPGIEPGGFGIRVYESPGGQVPPASGTGVASVRVGNVLGRWTPDQGELEWVDGGVYRSVTAPGLGLAEVVAIAGSLGGP